MPSTLANEVAAQLRAAGREGLRRAAEQVLEQASRNAPDGDPALDPDPNVSLAASGRIVEDGDGLVVIFDAPYAAKQHEAQHLKHPRGGGAKYLESALTEIIPRLEKIVAGDVLAHMRRNPTGAHRRTATSVLQRVPGGLP
jgi:hypothetical protein